MRSEDEIRERISHLLALKNQDMLSAEGWNEILLEIIGLRYALGYEIEECIRKYADERVAWGGNKTDK